MEANTEGQQYRAAAVLYTRHSYVSFLYSLGAHSGFISSQTLGSDYAKYSILKKPTTCGIGIAADRKGATLVQSASEVDHSPTPRTKKPLISQGLKGGAGEEGRTPDLMLGKHTL